MIDWSVIAGLIWGMNIGLIIAVLHMEIRKYKLYKHGVLHTNKGTFVTTDSNGGYTFTSKLKGSKRV